MSAVVQKCEFTIGNARIEIVMQGGFSEQGTHRSVEMHRHPNFEVHYIEEGSFSFMHADNAITVGKDTLVIIPPKLDHAFKGETDSLKRLSFELKLIKLKNGADVYSDYEKMFSSITSPLFIHRFIPEFIQLGECMGIISGEEEICRLNAYFTLSFLIICDILRQKTSIEPRAALSRTAQVSSSDEDLTLIKILDYIRKFCHRPLTLSEVARFSSLSERQVQRILSARMGESFHAILSKNRITAARSMISSIGYANRSLEEIAYECGYSNYVSFWSQFKKATGQTPEQYRRLFKTQ